MIWWCVEHECSFQPDYLLNCDAREGNLRAEDYVSTGSLAKECRRVEALLIVKENGQWPDAVGRDTLTESVRYERVRLALDALTVQKGTG